jgi:hypothetical protein
MRRRGGIKSERGWNGPLSPYFRSTHTQNTGTFPPLARMKNPVSNQEALTNNLRILARGHFTFLHFLVGFISYLRY